MPRKTRREKIQAELRKSITTPSFTPSAMPHVDTTATQKTDANPFRFDYSAAPFARKKQALQPISGYASIRGDLVKTLVLSAVALLSEFVLYYTLK